MLLEVPVLTARAPTAAQQLLLLQLLLQGQTLCYCWRGADQWWSGQDVVMLLLCMLTEILCVDMNGWTCGECCQRRTGPYAAGETVHGSDVAVAAW